MRICTLILLLFFSKVTCSQELNHDSLFNVFQKDIEIEQTYNEGRVVWGDHTKENFYLLMIVSPVDTLIKYITNSNPAIKCFIFSGLINKNADEEVIKEIANNHINDTASFQNMPTDVVQNWTVNEYMQIQLIYRGETKIDYEERIKEIRQTLRVVLEGERHGRICKEDFLNIDSLYLNSYNDYKISSFSLSYKKNAKWIEKKSENNQLTSEMKRNIKKMNSTDILNIENIEVISPDGDRRLIPSIKIQLK
jgi:hypothetical protein